MQRQQGGFTLIELMITIAIAAVLITLSVNMRDIVANNRRAAAINEFLAAISYARNEAITRGTRVTICRSNDTTAATPACDTTAGRGWETGWIVFTDTSTVGTVNTGTTDVTTDGTAGILKRHGPLGANLTLRGNTNVANFISYTAGGTLLTPFGNGTIMVCDARGLGTSANYYARKIVTNQGGRMKALKPDNTDTCP